MKRRDLLRRLAAAGFVLGRSDLRIAVPRHAEIKEHLARKILKEAGVL